MFLNGKRFCIGLKFLNPIKNKKFFEFQTKKFSASHKEENHSEEDHGHHGHHHYTGEVDLKKLIIPLDKKVIKNLI